MHSKCTGTRARHAGRARLPAVRCMNCVASPCAWIGAPILLRAFLWTARGSLHSAASCTSCAAWLQRLRRTPHAASFSRRVSSGSATRSIRRPKGLHARCSARFLRRAMVQGRRWMQGRQGMQPPCTIWSTTSYLCVMPPKVCGRVRMIRFRSACGVPSRPSAWARPASSSSTEPVSTPSHGVGCSWRPRAAPLPSIPRTPNRARHPGLMSRRSCAPTNKGSSLRAVAPATRPCVRWCS